MSGATSLAFPGSRKLAGWWRQLASIRPQALWVAHLLFHQVEAPVRLAGTCRPDQLTLFLLKALALEEDSATPEAGASPDWLDLLDHRLHLGPQLLRQALRGLQAEGLAATDPEGRWRLTPLGRQALEGNDYPCTRQERRTFHFRADPASSSSPRRPPSFLDVHNSTGIPWPVVEGEPFDPGLLQACLEQPAAWKRKHGFPEEVQEIVGLKPESSVSSPSAPGSLPWQQIIVDRPESLLTALVLAPRPEGGSRLLGLAVRPEGWGLQSATPLFSLGPDWPEVFPELAQDPGLEPWHKAWRNWCERNRVPGELAGACLLERRAERLRVAAPPRLGELLRAGRNEALQGEFWLLAGEGPIRSAARVELVEALPPGPGGSAPG